MATAKLLVEGLVVMNNLSVLSLDHNSFNEMGWLHIGNVLGKSCNIRRLSLEDCVLNIRKWDFASIVKQHPKLEFINLMHNKLSKESINALRPLRGLLERSEGEVLHLG